MLACLALGSERADSLLGPALQTHDQQHFVREALQQELHPVVAALDLESGFETFDGGSLLVLAGPGALELHADRLLDAVQLERAVDRVLSISRLGDLRAAKGDRRREGWTRD